jgi:hypothetical protein
MRWRLPALSGLLFWITLGGLAPAAPAPRLAYAAIDVDRAYGRHLAVAAAALPRAVPTRAAPRALVRDVRTGASAWRLTVNGGVTADSNIRNASDDRFLEIRRGGTTVPVELDPAFRARGGVGRGASVSGNVKLRLSDGAAIVVDADGQAMDHKGGRNDDISFLLAAGPELTWSEGQSLSVQAVAAQSWYGGRISQRGLGAQVRYAVRVAPGTRVSLSLDGRSVDSGYGRGFGGEQAGAYLGASTVVDPVTSASFGLFARREWLRADEYSNTELGLYAGLSRYVGPFTGSLTAGISRTRYDAPLLYLSDQRRQDWRWNAGVQLTTREPIGMGVYPTIGYSYTRTDGTIEFFDADRHRLRLGVRRTF